MYPIHDFSQIDSAFPADVLDYMPFYSDIPKEYKGIPGCAAVRYINNWFFNGLPSFEAVPREGVDPEKAFRHLHTILSSWQPKHEHKIAATAFLLDEWFKEYSNGK